MTAERRSTGHALLLRLPKAAGERLGKLAKKCGVSKTRLALLAIAAALESGEAMLTEQALKSKGKA